MSLFSRRLEELLHKNDLTAAELSRKTKIPESAISSYRSGKYEAKQKRLELLAHALHTTPSYLMGWDFPEAAEAAGLEPDPPIKTMPVLGRVSAGLPLYAEETVEGYVANDYCDAYQYFALRVRGDSMNAAGIDDGDVVVVRRQDLVDDGQVAVVLVNRDDATVKYWHRQGRTVMLSPKSYNPEHQLQVYDSKNVSIRILGRVVQIRKEVF